MELGESIDPVVVVSSKADWKLARALASFWCGDSRRRELLEPSEWVRIVRIGSQRAASPGLVAWRLDSVAALSTALVSVRLRAKVLSPICFYGTARSQALPLFDNDVAVRRPSSYWWLDLKRPELLDEEEIAAQLRRALPEDWRRWTTSEPSVEVATRRIEPVCDLGAMAAWLFHGSSPKRAGADDIVRYVEALSLIRPFLEVHASGALISEVDEVTDGVGVPDATRVVSLVQTVKALASERDEE